MPEILISCFKEGCVGPTQNFEPIGKLHLTCYEEALHTVRVGRAYILRPKTELQLTEQSSSFQIRSRASGRDGTVKVFFLLPQTTQERILYEWLKSGFLRSTFKANIGFLLLT